MFFEAPAVSAAARVSVRKNRHLSEFSGHAVETVKNLAIDNDAAADSSPQSKQDQVFHVLTGAHPHFAERRRVRIVFQNDRSAQPGLDLVAYREALKSRQVGQTDHQPGTLTKKPGNAVSSPSQPRAPSASRTSLMVLTI